MLERSFAGGIHIVCAIGPSLAEGGPLVTGGIPDYVTAQRHIIDNVMAFLWNPNEFLDFGWVCQLINYSITVVTDKLSEQLIDELMF